MESLAQAATDAEIVVNNAGVLFPEPLLTGGFTHVTETFDVNVFGPLRVARAFAPILAANGGGALVNIHSVLSWLGGDGGDSTSVDGAAFGGNGGNGYNGTDGYGGYGGVATSTGPGVATQGSDGISTPPGAG